VGAALQAPADQQLVGAAEPGDHADRPPADPRAHDQQPDPAARVAEQARAAQRALELQQPPAVGVIATQEGGQRIHTARIGR
jgi:hypothetical protein